MTISEGVTVDAEPGAMVKLTGTLTVKGTLDVNGSAEEPVVFTSSSDSAPGQWTGIALQAGAGESIISHAEVRYAKTAVAVSGEISPEIVNSMIHDNSSSGISASGGSTQITGNTLSDNGDGILVSGNGNPVIAENTIENCSGHAISHIVPDKQSGEARIHDNVIEGCGSSSKASIRAGTEGFSSSLTGVTLAGNTIADGKGIAISFAGLHSTAVIPPDVTDNTITGNASNTIRLGGTLAESTTWESRGAAILASGSTGFNVADGVSLTLEPGLVVKFEQTNTFAQIAGELIAKGTASEPITFTSIKDDSVGGDTNMDGSATQPQPGDFVGTRFSAGTASQAPGRGDLAYVDARYGGRSVSCGACGPMFDFGGPASGGPTSTPSTIQHSTFEHSTRPAIGGNYFSSIQSSTFSSNGTAVSFNCPCPAEPKIRDSKFFGNSKGVVVSGEPAGGAPPIVASSQFKGNTSKAIEKTGSGSIWTPYNDYGCESGPRPMGCGDEVSTNVNPMPTATEERPCVADKKKCKEGADPVVLSTGALAYTHRDLYLTNKGKSPLEFIRSYNSSDPSDASLGYGWSHDGLISAMTLESGDVIVRHADGRTDLFVETEEGYEAPSGITDVLTLEEGGKFRLTMLDRTVYDFRADGRIATIADDHGLKTTYGYNASGRLTTITDPSSQVLAFSYDASNHITKVADSTGREVKYAYTTAGDLKTVTDALGSVTEYSYDAEHRITSIKDPRGNVILQNTYDPQGRVIEQLDGLENLWKLEYKEGETIVTEPEGGETTYEFDEEGRVVAETDQLGRTTTTSYDAAGNVEEIVKPGGAGWSFDHDAAGNLVSTVDPEDGERSYEYDELNRLTAFTDEREETWTYEWSEDNDLVKVTDPAEGETTATHNAAGQPLAITDPNEDTTTFSYDGRGNRLTVEDPLENTTSFEYNARNHLIAQADPGLEAEQFGRNALGELTSQTTPEGNTTAYGRNANGMVTEVIDPAEGVWEIERNAMERPTAYIDPHEARTEIEYDGNLNQVAVTDRRGKTTTYAHDAANQVVGIERPEGGDWELGYDARGNLSELIDPRENATAYEHDLADRMTEVAEPLATVAKYGYDAAGNLTSYTDPRGHTTALHYDELGRLTQVAQPLGKLTDFTYDPLGRQLTRTTAAGTLTYDYDPAGRLREIAEGEATLRSYDYDPAGRLIAATDAQSDEIEVAYDDDGLPTSIDDGRSQSLSREYDSRGNLVEQVDGRGTLTYGYDALGRMTSLTNPQAGTHSFDYDPEGNLLEAELPNGVVRANVFDDAGRLAKTSAVGAEEAILESLEYDYDPFGNRTGQTDRLSQETTYSYDALNRLTEFDPPGEGATAWSRLTTGKKRPPTVGAPSTSSPASPTKASRSPTPTTPSGARRAATTARPYGQPTTET